MTLVLKFFCCNKMTKTRRRSNLFPKFRKIPAALDEYFAMAVSNRDLKPFCFSFSEKMHATSDSQDTFVLDVCSWRATMSESYVPPITIYIYIYYIGTEIISHRYIFHDFCTRRATMCQQIINKNNMNIL